jgi:uncharacterized protein (DUF433 family)
MQLPDFLTEQSAGAIRLTGHRIGLEHVIYFYNQGYSPEMILGQFPSLPLAVIHKVIAFYLEHQADVDSYVTHCDAELSLQRASAQASPDVAELRRRAAQQSTAAVP